MSRHLLLVCGVGGVWVCGAVKCGLGPRVSARRYRGRTWSGSGSGPRSSWEAQ